MLPLLMFSIIPGACTVVFALSNQVLILEFMSCDNYNTMPSINAEKMQLSFMSIPSSRVM